MAGTMEHTTVLLTWQGIHEFAALPSELQVLYACDQYIFPLQGLIDTTHHADNTLIFCWDFVQYREIYIPIPVPSILPLFNVNLC